MIISCPKCSTGFFVSRAQIGSTGRRLKCSKCKHIWHLHLPEESVAQQEIIAQRIDTTIVSGANLPAIIPVKISSILYILPIIFLVLISFTTYVFYPEVTLKLGICGPMCTEKGIILEDVIYDFERVTNKFIIEYSVANRTAQPKVIPVVQVTLLDSLHKVKRIYTSEKPISLEPNSSSKNKLEFDNVSPNTKYAQIVMGSPIKFWFR